MAATDAETRETMYSYASTSTFMGSKHQPCRFRTALCPHQCGHATNVFTFQLDRLTVMKNEESTNARWVEPVKEGNQYMIGEQDLREFRSAAEALKPGQKLLLEWSHDYVTINGSSGPDRPVRKLVPLVDNAKLETDR